MSKKLKNNLQKKLSVLVLISMLNLQISPILILTTYAEDAPTESVQTEAQTEAQIQSQTETQTETRVETEIVPVETTSVENIQGQIENVENENQNSETESASSSVETLIITESENASSTNATTTVSTESLEEILDGFTSTSTFFDINSNNSSNTISTSSLDLLPNATTTISTGDAVSETNIINTVNTNLVNSTGTIIFSNLDGHTGDLDFRTSTTTNENATNTCTFLACNGVRNTEVKINADANIRNNVRMDADTGTNTIQVVKTAIIETGDSFTGLNLVNVANTNLIDSSYLVLSLNSFNTINGDIVLPGISNLLSDARFDNRNILSNVENIRTNETANIRNNVRVDANAGENSAEGADTTINSGTAFTSTNIYNKINSVLTGGNSVSLLLRVSGTWAGELFGLPTGVEFVRDGNARILEYQNTFGSTRMSSSILNVNFTTTANIENDVDLNSNTGKNKTVDTEKSVINSGDAYASANIINIANTNIISRNWVLAIINIFGDFNGNLSFGRPDLWVGQQLESDEVIDNGSEILLKMTVTNKGDSPSTETNFSSTYDTEHLNILNASENFTETTNGNLNFSLGILEPNQTKEIIITAVVKNTEPGTQITNTTNASLRETDNNYSDNTDVASFRTTGAVVNTGGGGGGGEVIIIIPISTTTTTTNNNSSQNNNSNENTNSNNLVENNKENNQVQEVKNTNYNISVERVVSTTTISENSLPVKQTLIFKNLTNQNIPNAKFEDVMYDPNGKEIKVETWDLGEVLANEEITLTYEVFFAANATVGTYTFSSYFLYDDFGELGFKNNGSINYVRENNILSNINKENLENKTNNFGGIVLGIFNENFVTTKAEADSLSSIALTLTENESEKSQKNLYYLMLCILLFTTSSMYMFMKKNIF